MAIKLSISKAWDETREIFRRDGSLITTVALALIVLPEVVVGIIAPPQAAATADPSTVNQLLRLAAGLIALVGQLSLIRLTLGPSTTVGDAIGHGARRFPSTFGAIFLLALALTILAVPVIIILALALGVDVSQMQRQPSGPAGLLILILALGVLAISIRFTLVSPIGSAESIGPIGIIKRSWRLTAGNYWRLLGFVVLLLIAALVLIAAAGIVGSLLARLVSSDLEPFSISALIIALVGGAAQGAFSVLAALMLARVYAQAASGSENVEETLR